MDNIDETPSSAVAPPAEAGAAPIQTTKPKAKKPKPPKAQTKKPKAKKPKARKVNTVATKKPAKSKKPVKSKKVTKARKTHPGDQVCISIIPPVYDAMVRVLTVIEKKAKKEGKRKVSRSRAIAEAFIPWLAKRGATAKEIAACKDWLAKKKTA